MPDEPELQSGHQIFGLMLVVVAAEFLRLGDKVYQLRLFFFRIESAKLNQSQLNM